MELKVKLWHVLAVLGIILISGSIFIGVWVKNNNEHISALNKDIKKYDVQIKDLQRDFDFVARSDERKGVVIDSLVGVIEEKDAAIKGLKWSIRKIKTELQYEKERIMGLDSTQQFELLRTNLDLMLRRAGSEGR